MKHVLLIAGAAIALGACNKSPKVDEKNATAAEVAQKLRESGADQGFVHPGRWQSRVTVDEFDVPGMPPEMAQRMKTMMAERQEHSFETCLTPEDVKKPKEDFFAGKSKECRYEHFTMGDGKIDAAMHCGGRAGASVMQMAGSYSPDSYHMQTAMQMQGGRGDERGISMKMHIDSQRVGECSAKQG